MAPSLARVFMCRLCECALAEGETLGYFHERVAGILEFDVRRDVPLLAAQHLQDWRNRRVALAPAFASRWRRPGSFRVKARDQAYCSRMFSGNIDPRR